jgi:hypothetical protein
METFQYRFLAEEDASHPFESVVIRVRAEHEELAWEEAVSLLRAGKIASMKFDVDEYEAG